jgi:hypothetical protein
MPKLAVLVAALATSLLPLAFPLTARSASPWAPIGRPAAAPLSPVANVAAFQFRAGQLGVFDVGQDGVLYQRVHIHGRWGPWIPLGRPAGAPLSAGGAVAGVVLGAGRFALFATGQDGQLYGRAWTAGRGWTVWARIGRPAATPLSTTAPVAAATFFRVARVFAVGQDGQLYERQLNRHASDQWIRLARPAAAPLSPNARLDVVHRPRQLVVYAIGQDGQVYARARNPVRWGAWGSVGRPVASPLSVGAATVATDLGQSHPTLFAVGQDGQVYKRAWNGTLGNVWSSLGRPAASALSPGARVAVVSSSLHRDVLAIGQDGRLYVDTWSNGAWQGWAAAGQAAALPLSPSAPITPFDVNAGLTLLFAVGQDGRLYVTH